MTQKYTQKTWASEVILDADMNRMEYGIAGRSYHVFAGGTKGDFDDLQEAIDKCESDGGGTVIVHGEIVAQSKLTVQGNNIALIGRDFGGLKKKTNLNDVLLELGITTTPVENVLVSGLLIDGNKANQSGSAQDIHVVRSQNIRIEKNKILNSKLSGIKFDNYAHNKVWVQGNLIESPAEDGIYFNGLDANCADIFFLENIINNAGFQGIDYMTTSNRVNISKNMLDTMGGEGIHIAADIYFLNICENILHGVASYGLYLSGPEIFVVTGNVISDVVDFLIRMRDLGNGVVGDNILAVSGESGIYGSNNVGLLIKGNMLTNIDKHGIIFNTTYGNNDDCHIEGNLIRACSQEVNNTYDGINVDMRYSGCTGNHITNQTATKHAHGIVEAGTKNHVNSNSQDGAATSGFVVGGTGSQSGGNTST